MKTREKLKKAKTLPDIASLLGYKAPGLSYVLYKIPDAAKYTEFKIPKKDGGDRVIQAPIEELKVLQQHLSSLLQNCLAEITSAKTYGRNLSHGFRRKHSIVTNARNHKNRRFVFNVDLKDFFPSINFGRVQGFFIKSNDFQLDPKIATIIAQIACHKGALPQGSPASPVISNLIGHVMDTRLVKLAKKHGCAYSRYADDLTFSTRAKEFPKELAEKDGSGVWSVGVKLADTIGRSGFVINEQKVSMQYRTSRQMTTGLVVNQKVNIAQPYYRQARAMCDALFRTGSFYIGKEMRWGTPKDSETLKIGTVNQLRGVLSFIYNVKKFNDQRDQKEKWERPTSIHKLFQRFLYFERFHAAHRPLIMFEGKTDSVYLKCAIKSLAAKFPEFVNLSKKQPDWKIEFLNHSDLNMDLLQFSGGTGDFPPFIGKYRGRMKRFLAPGQRYPVIILIDHDKGSPEVFSAAKQHTGSKVDGSKDFYHLTLNLYLVSLPKPKGASEFAIEDCFDPTLKATVLDGKTFEPDTKKFDPNKHYGKQVFADKVVRQNQKTIDFDGFEPTLQRIQLAITDYAKRLASS